MLKIYGLLLFPLVALLCFNSSPLSAQDTEPRVPQNWAKVTLTFQNRNRHAFGELNQECSPCFPHSCPFGNWGVNSNVGVIQDSLQFAGWNGDLEWNSCTQGQWEAPSPSYYNYANYTEQKSNAIYPYAGEVICYPLLSGHEAEGCAYLNSRKLTFSGNYLSVYELDPFSGDAFIKTLNYPTLQITYTGCTAFDCPSISTSWKDVTSYSPSTGGQIINAQIRLLMLSCEPVDDQCP